MGKIVFYVFLLVFIGFETCSSQVLQFGVCPKVETMRFFDLERFLGKWFEIERFPTWYEENGHCAYKTIQACGRRIEIQHGFVREGIQYILHVNSTYIPGDEAVFNIQESNIDPVGIPLSVIITDYNNYAVVYGCKSSKIFDMKYISAWILSRDTTLHPEILETARQTLNSIPNANLAYLKPVEQSEGSCTYHWTAHINADYKEKDDGIIDNDRK
ncbi:lopap-like [Pectinophora gossypiella]|uniref:lopap-like n=1 Tax=Pectinophora gossypiella TaxID=13191 RepID=UPI00214F1E01|nr:lopap-like [Pectinophora gossypiella]